MNEIADDQVPDSMFEEASIWYMRLRDRGPAPRNPDFDRWLALDARHILAYDEVKALWERTAKPAHAVQRELPRPRRVAARRRVLALAAGIGALALSGAWVWESELQNLRADVVTAPGQMRTLQLADGSEILLDTDTALQRSASDERYVRLLRGRAYFTVVHSDEHPFVVDVPQGRVRDLGTRFDVRVGEEKTIVSVDEGLVAISADTAGMGQAVPLEAGEQASLEAQGPTDAQPFDDRAVAAWRRGQMVFYRAPLSEVAAELGRYHGGSILVVGSRLNAMPVTGVFNAADADGAVSIIQETLDARRISLGSALIVLY